MLKKQKELIVKDFVATETPMCPPMEGLPAVCAFSFIYKGEKLVSFYSLSHDRAGILPLQSTSAFNSQEGEYSRLNISGLLQSCG